MPFTPAGPAPQTASIPQSAAAFPPGKVLRGLQDGVSVKSSTKIPIVCLDVDTIKDEVAAKLATSLLGHVLFLKNQIPLPVLQLARMTGTRSTARAAKHRTDLLNSFDTLTSHLSTTFTALSTALAVIGRSSNYPPHPHWRARSQAYLAILVGPSLSSSRSKVVFAVDGFETKVWGERENGEGHDARVKEATINPEGEEEDTDEEDTGEGIKDDEDEDPFESDKSEGEGEEEDDGEEEKGESQSDGEPSTDDDGPPASPSPPPPYHSRAEEQRALQAAERLLARVLAAADAEGNGMSAEMAPTQTHILIRAPRRFTHPAWVPRQNMTAGMDAMLDGFLEESGALGKESRPTPVEMKAKKWKKTGMEGVWVTDREGLVSWEGLDGKDSGVSDERDEMIWWSWEEKIVGFSEW